MERILLFSALFILLFIWGSEYLNKETSIVDPGGDPPNVLFMIADDWSFPHAGILEDPVVRTPVFDRLAGEGALFTNAFCSAPSCSPSRASILTGQYPHQLESAGNLWSVFPDKFDNWVSILQDSGYHVGKTRKGWGPGDYQRGGYEHNPAGKDYSSFASFLEERESSQPFCFWFGSSDPHRSYVTNSGAESGLNLDSIVVPEFLPDLACVRNDLADYYYEVERFDSECGELLELLESNGLIENTLVIMTSDNGMPFPRAKANLYDYGTRMPLVIYWKGKIVPGIIVEDLVSFTDFAPTLLEVAGIEAPSSFVGKSLVPFLSNFKRVKNWRKYVASERERHANVREGDLSYPIRSIRTEDFLYIKNYETERWPAGDPQTHQAVGQYGDIDNSISKFLILHYKEEEEYKHLYDLAMAKRPAEELYDISRDPYNLDNLAGFEEYQEELELMTLRLEEWMEMTSDPRKTDPQTIYWDTVEYTPNYQFSDFNLASKIEEYQMLRHNGNDPIVEVPCME